MEPVGPRSGSKIEIFDFAGHTIIADFSPVRNSHTPTSADEASFSGESSSIFEGGVWGLFIGR